MEVLNFLNAVLYVMENGCKWRRLPERFGNWHTIYTRMNRWSKNGVWDRPFARLQQEGVLTIEWRGALDGTSVKVHPDGTGAGEKRAAGPGQIQRWLEHQGSSGGHEDIQALGFRLSPGRHGDGPEGREPIGDLGCPTDGCALAMDMAYEGDETRGLASLLGFTPLVPPHPQRLIPWKPNKPAYPQRNHVERLFRRLKGFRRIFTRYDKLDVIFGSFALLWLALL